MKNIIMLLLLPLLSIGLFSCSDPKSSQEEVVNGISVPRILPRANPKDSTNEYKSIVQTYNEAIAKLKENKDDDQAFLNLATAFILEGRITGNSSYYSSAAIKMLDHILNESNANPDQKFQALSLKSTVQLNMHQFKDALATANQGLAINNYNAGIYGALIDANVEMGNYKAAVEDCDKMLSIRPDIRSYSRASYLRQIHGDNAGAIVAMKMAVESGVPGMEQTEWARVTLGDLYLNIGKLDSASYTYRTSLVYRPDYPHAQMGMAKVMRAEKNYDSSITYTKAAIHTLSESSFISFLADIYELKGDKEKADKIRKDVIDLLVDAEEKNGKEGLIPHNGNRELAVAYMNAGQYDKAMEYAKKDYDMRPDNIDANELMAWISYNKGDFAQAKSYAEKTLATSSRNANSLYKNAMIFGKAGDAVRSDSTRKLAMNVSPYIDQRIVNAEKQ